METTITVVVVNYNQARFVEECLDSVRAQTRPADQVLILDDASTDSSARTIRDYLDRHPSFATFLQNKENIGLNATLNRALLHVTTDLYAVIAADDLMAPERLATQEGLITAGNHLLAYSDATVVDEQSRTLHATSRIEYPWPEEPRRSQATFAALLDGNWILAASLLLRTEPVQSSGGYPDPCSKTTNSWSDSRSGEPSPTRKNHWCRSGAWREE